jgi:hypothetical protein
VSSPAPQGGAVDQLHEFLLLVNVVVGVLLASAGGVTAVVFPGASPPHWVGVAIVIVGALQSTTSLLIRRLFPAAPAPALTTSGHGSP